MDDVVFARVLLAGFVAVLVGMALVFVAVANDWPLSVSYQDIRPVAK